MPENKKLTDAEKAAYLADPAKCPYCGSRGTIWSNQIHVTVGPSFKCDVKMGEEVVGCRECGKVWKLLYAVTLTAIEEVS